LSEDDVCLACSGRFKWRRYASLWRAIVCEAVRLCNHGVPSCVMPPVFEPTPKLLARDVFEEQNMLPNSSGISLSKRLCQRTLSSFARPGNFALCAAMLASHKRSCTLRSRKFCLVLGTAQQPLILHVLESPHHNRRYWRQSAFVISVHNNDWSQGVSFHSRLLTTKTSESERSLLHQAVAPLPAHPRQETALTLGACGQPLHVKVHNSA